MSAAATIPQALLGGDGTLARGVTGTVSAAWPDMLYMQTEGRSCGVRVTMAAHGRKAGDVVAVDGVVGTGEEGERRIAASSTTLVGSALTEPLCLPLARLGGGDWHYDASSGAGRRGVRGGGGLNNVGLLVRINGWGGIRRCRRGHVHRVRTLGRTGRIHCDRSRHGALTASARQAGERHGRELLHQGRGRNASLRSSARTDRHFRPLAHRRQELRTSGCNQSSGACAPSTTQRKVFTRTI